MAKWRMFDLFSGIGGFSLAASWVWGNELEIVAFCEIDPFCQKVLNKHWPGVPIIPDIKELTIEKVMADTGISQSAQPQGSVEKCGDRVINGSKRIDLITGGFPCQPFSVAGKRKGAEDERALWPEMYRAIKEFKPRWVVGENVAGFVNMGLDDSCADLEAEGYEVQPFIIPACAINAPHRRDRVWIVAYDANRQDNRRERGIMAEAQERRQGCDTAAIAGRQDVADADSGRRTPIINAGNGAEAHRRRQDNIESGSAEDVADTGEYSMAFNGQSGQDKGIGTGKIQANDCREFWSVEPNVGRVVDGVSSFMDHINGIPITTEIQNPKKSKAGRVHRLKGLGNAIVPQVAAMIMQAIKDVERG